MERLTAPPSGSQIQIKQTSQQIRVKIPVDFSMALVVAIYMLLFYVGLIVAGMRAVQNENIADSVAWLYLGAAIGCIAMIGFFLVSHPTWYPYPPCAQGDMRFQWTVQEIKINRLGWYFQMGTPFRRRWVYIPQSAVYGLKRFDERFWVLGRQSGAQYCILRTRQGDYMFGDSLSIPEQQWLVTTLSNFLSQSSQTNSVQA